MKIWYINLFWGHEKFHTKFGPDRFSRFDVYWIQTDRQTNKQTSQVYIYNNWILWDRECFANIILWLHVTNNLQTNKTNPKYLKTYFEKQGFVIVLFQTKIIRIKNILKEILTWFNLYIQRTIWNGSWRSYWIISKL